MDVLQLNGWKIYFHGCFLEQMKALTLEVSALKAAKPDEYMHKKPVKLLAAIRKVIEEQIAADPLNAKYRQGDTLGGEYKHWFRVRFLQQFRLFYRCSEQHKTIVIGWVNSVDTLRAYGSKTDAYRVFSAILKSGNPPDDWGELLAQAKKEATDSADSTPGPPRR